MPTSKTGSGLEASDAQRLPRHETASSVLAKFLPNSPTTHKMNSTHSLRMKAPISYTELEGSLSPLKTPQRKVIDLLDEEDSDDEIRFSQPRSSGRSLRDRKSIGLSVKAIENASKRTPRSSSARSHRKGAGKGNPITFDDVDELSFTPTVTDRQAVRHEIANITAAKRHSFLVEKKDYFLPLLPEHNNYIKKLAEKHEAMGPEEKAKIPKVVPYQQLEAQPKGIKAVMKPYQLSGLSFMVYLHRNGLSGILGDEMGLGKTLQTISLIQYLKENEPKTGAQLRPVSNSLLQPIVHY
jgi:SNF2 family DNA or RNA helicase